MQIDIAKMTAKKLTKMNFLPQTIKTRWTEQQ